MIRHSLVSTKLRRRALRVWGSWVILRGCAACNKTTHSTILSGNTHLSGVCTNTKTHKHIKQLTTDLNQKCMYYNWTAQETHNVLSNMKCTSVCFDINRLRVLCTLWQPQTTQSTREVQCTLGKCVVRLGGCACSFWLTHSFGPATIFTCPPFPPAAMYTFI